MIIGKVVSIKGQVVEAEFLEEKPHIYDVLVAKDDPEIKMEVYTSASPNSFYCLALTEIAKLHHASELISTKQPIRIPVGKELLGRVVDTLGQPQDGLGEITAKEQRPIISKDLSFSQINIPKEVLETGIKVLDFFTPIIKGGKVGLFGGAGVGKTVLLSEIIHNIVSFTPKPTSPYSLALVNVLVKALNCFNPSSTAKSCKASLSSTVAWVKMLRSGLEPPLPASPSPNISATLWARMSCSLSTTSSVLPNQATNCQPS
jgi:vacuolar-type H+-ATPase catalytic subunit A/Vma1